MIERAVFVLKSKRSIVRIKKEINFRRDSALMSVIAIFISLYSAFSFTTFACVAQGVKAEVVRLHILANSDSAVDQEVKLKVRDALLKQNTRLLSSGVNKENAKAYFEQARSDMLDVANGVLRANGLEYDVSISLEEEYYETREYGELTFPAGEYLSLKVVLGAGEGHNWWCVMFPPMCVPMADDVTSDSDIAEQYLSEQGKELVSSGGKYIIKFKIVEIYEELRELLGV